ncbi:MAG: hypothetical protein R3268_08925 [Acidiferrobacterales bacterium]|nr:hypothetical protein [Acidiferrobacterales bacterium]
MARPLTPEERETYHALKRRIFEARPEEVDELGERGTGMARPRARYRCERCRQVGMYAGMATVKGRRIDLWCCARCGPIRRIRVGEWSAGDTGGQEQ